MNLFCLQTHRDAKHEEKKPYHCAHCEESFAQKRKLYVHVQAMHTGKHEFACDQCDASYAEQRMFVDYPVFLIAANTHKILARISQLFSNLLDARNPNI